MIDGASSASRELILYATPTGPLAQCCSAYFEWAGNAPTAAQEYPPHCTLTGFFRRGGPRADTLIERTKAIVAAAGPVPDDAVEVVSLLTTDEWVGLELRSPWMLALAAEVAGADQPVGAEDALRLKDWLHLSLAYGIEDLSDHATRARGSVDIELAVGWEVALWERHHTQPGSQDHRWTRL